MKTICTLANGVTLSIDWDPADDGASTVVKNTIQRMSDEIPAAIRDRCYSLVQSMANGEASGYTDERVIVYEEEAKQIAIDAGWLK